METNVLPWVVVILPFIGFLINAFLGAGFTKSPHATEHSEAHGQPGHGDAHGSHDAHGHGGHGKPVKGASTVGGLASAFILGSFVCSLLLLFQVLGMAGEERRLFSSRFEWMPQIGLSFGLVVDPLSALMMNIITGVGFLIHVYSIGYMGTDRGVARYFTYLNLFVFFMLLLVMGSNLLVLFVSTLR